MCVCVCVVGMVGNRLGMEEKISSFNSFHSLFNSAGISGIQSQEYKHPLDAYSLVGKTDNKTKNHPNKYMYLFPSAQFFSSVE